MPLELIQCNVCGGELVFDMSASIYRCKCCRALYERKKQDTIYLIDMCSTSGLKQGIKSETANSLPVNFDNAPRTAKETVHYKGKYEPLYQYLKKQNNKCVQLSFSEIESILGFQLPKSASTYTEWWNPSGHSYCQSWVAAGYTVSNSREIINTKVVVFEKSIKSKTKNSLPVNFDNAPRTAKETVHYKGKYEPLYQYLKKQNNKCVQLSFSEIESILGFQLPKSASTYTEWWNPSGHSHCQSWVAAGYTVSNSKEVINTRVVIFEK